MKRALLFTLALFVAGVLHGQEKLEIGIVAGGGYFNTIQLKEIIDFTDSFSANAGLYLLKPVFKQQFIESGLLFNYRKTGLDQTFMQLDIPVNSLELPLNYGYRLSEKLFVKGGVSAGFLISKKIERYKTEFNGQLGLGYDLKWMKFILSYQRSINKTHFMFNRGDIGLLIDYHRSSIKLDINLPLIRF